MKNSLTNTLLLILWPLAFSLSACSQDDDSHSPATPSAQNADKNQEARGVKQTPLPTGPQLKDRL